MNLPWQEFSMTRIVQIVLLPTLLVIVGPWAAAGEKNAEQEQAIAAIKRMKGGPLEVRLIWKSKT